MVENKRDRVRSNYQIFRVALTLSIMLFSTLNGFIDGPLPSSHLMSNPDNPADKGKVAFVNLVWRVLPAVLTGSYKVAALD